MTREKPIDDATRAAARITGLAFFGALAIINLLPLLDDERRRNPTEGRTIYALGLPGWVVDGAVEVFLIGVLVAIVVSWVRERRRNRGTQQRTSAQ